MKGSASDILDVLSEPIKSSFTFWSLLSGISALINLIEEICSCFLADTELSDLRRSRGCGPSITSLSLLKNGKLFGA
jgi:hypothetical protein